MPVTLEKYNGKERRRANQIDGGKWNHQKSTDNINWKIGNETKKSQS